MGDGDGLSVRDGPNGNNIGSHTLDSVVTDSTSIAVRMAAVGLSRMKQHKVITVVANMEVAAFWLRLTYDGHDIKSIYGEKNENLGP